MRLPSVNVIVTVVVVALVGLVLYSMVSMGQVPVIKVQAAVTVSDDRPAVRIVEMKQEKMNSLQSPKGNSDVGFPAVEAIGIVNRAKMSYWAARSYHGNGTYNFTIGFPRDVAPKKGDRVMVIVRVVNEKGRTLAQTKKEQDVN